jgi:hypothetical protein
LTDFAIARYQTRFVQEFMLHVLDVRDALDTERFLHVHFDPVFDGQSTGAGAGASQGIAAAVPSDGSADEKGGLTLLSPLFPLLESSSRPIGSQGP